MVHIVCSIYQSLQQASELDTDTYKIVTSALIAANGLTCIAVIFTNFTAIYTIVKTSSLHTPSNFFIMGLAMSDLAVGLLAQPALITVQISDVRKDYEFFCDAIKVFEFIGWALASVSILTVTALTADRFLAIQFHLRYQDFVTNKRVGFVLLCIWCYGLVTGALKIVIGKYVLILHVIILVPTGIFNLFCLVKIHLTVRRHSAQIAHQGLPNIPRMKKTVYVTYLIVAAFAVFYLPYVGCVAAVAIMGIKTTHIVLAYRITESIVLFNSLVNPLIYYWRIGELRNATKQLLCV